MMISHEKHAFIGVYVCEREKEREREKELELPVLCNNSAVEKQLVNIKDSQDALYIGMQLLLNCSDSICNRNSCRFLSHTLYTRISDGVR